MDNSSSQSHWSTSQRILNEKAVGKKAAKKQRMKRRKHVIAQNSTVQKLSTDNVASTAAETTTGGGATMPSSLHRHREPIIPPVFRLQNTYKVKPPIMTQEQHRLLEHFREIEGWGGTGHSDSAAAESTVRMRQENPTPSKYKALGHHKQMSDRHQEQHSDNHHHLPQDPYITATTKLAHLLGEGVNETNMHASQHQNGLTQKNNQHANKRRITVRTPKGGAGVTAMLAPMGHAEARQNVLERQSIDGLHRQYRTSLHRVEAPWEIQNASRKKRQSDGRGQTTSTMHQQNMDTTSQLRFIQSSSVSRRQLSPKKRPAITAFRVQTADGNVTKIDNLRQFHMNTSPTKSPSKQQRETHQDQKTESTNRASSSMSSSARGYSSHPPKQSQQSRRAQSQLKQRAIPQVGAQKFQISSTAQKRRSSVAHASAIHDPMSLDETHAMDRRVEAEAYVREKQLSKIIDELRWKIGTEEREMPATKKRGRKRGDALSRQSPSSGVSFPFSPSAAQKQLPIQSPQKDIPLVEREMITTASSEYFTQKTHEIQLRKSPGGMVAGHLTSGSGAQSRISPLVSPRSPSNPHLPQVADPDYDESDDLLSHDELVKLGVAEIFVRRALERYKLHRFEAAEKDGDKDAVFVNLKAIEIYRKYGHREQDSGSSELPTTSQSAIVQLHEKYDFFTAENIFNNCALSYFCLDQFENALEMFHEALLFAESEPLDIQNHQQIRFYLFNKGCSLYYMHQLDEAIENLSMALSVEWQRHETFDPAIIADILYMRSLCYRFKQEFDLEEFDQQQIAELLSQSGLQMSFLTLCHQKFLDKSITLQIFSFLELCDLAHVCLSNKYWYRLVWSKRIVSNLLLDLSHTEPKALKWKSRRVFDLNISVDNREGCASIPTDSDFVLKSKRLPFKHLKRLNVSGIPLCLSEDDVEQAQEGYQRTWWRSNEEALGSCGEASNMTPKPIVYSCSIFSLLPALRELKLNTIVASSCNHVLREIGSLCSELRVLDLSTLNAPFSGSLRQTTRRWTFEFFPRLCEINVSHCSFENSFDIYSDLGLNCENLQRLVMSGVQAFPSDESSVMVNPYNLLKMNKKVVIET
eukprot:CAMPEP_0117444642 /NCGR_PEP_ID=MMETSP0759-20121206/5350_1 /TAXON_ID=63605 /ORGANISM="Percolomonas cosmopolitus, Strain WS" /LENGTH=1091 /DNA_ID=CAMNT_0005236723 /DNA_START=132 /DNA_END=3407 /DNA_ORIENTATION=+